jgi:hypothetical protein
VKYSDQELLAIAADYELDVTFEHEGTVKIWHGRARLSSGEGHTLAEALRSFAVINGCSLPASYLRFVESLELPSCAHDLGVFFGGEEGNPKKCRMCGEVLSGE